MTDPSAQQPTPPVAPSAPSVPVGHSGGGKESEFLPIGGKDSSPVTSAEVAPVEESEPTETESASPDQQVMDTPAEKKPVIIATPVSVQPPPVVPDPIPVVSLPISDQQVAVGMQANMSSSLAWLALWCQRKLKKAHLILQIVQGRIVRVPEPVNDHSHFPI